MDSQSITREPSSITREPSSLGSYLAYAMVLHAMLLFAGRLGSCRAQAPQASEPPARDPLVNIDTATRVDFAPGAEPGGGTPQGEKGASAPEPSVPAAPAPKAKAAAPARVVAPKLAEMHAAAAPPKPPPVAETVRAPGEGDDGVEPSISEPAEIADGGDPVEVADGGEPMEPAADAAPADEAGPSSPELSADMLAIAAKGGPEAHRSAYGTGPGMNGGPGGFGFGSKRAPKIRGNFTFGGQEGAFKATVCFIPPHTMSLAEISSCDPVVEFSTDVLDVPPRSFTQGFPGVSDRFEWFAIQYDGQFRVKKKGAYGFRLLSDDGSKLFIDDALVIDHDGTHAPTSKTGWAMLARGTHHMRVLYFQGQRTQIALQLFVTPPGDYEQLFTSSF